MAEAVLMPKVGISVESCIITAWLKQPGDGVAAGEALFDYETDKSALQCESTAAGVLLEQFFAAGDEVPVLVPVCAIGAAGEDVSALRPGAGGQAQPETPQPEPARQTASPAPAGPAQGAPQDVPPVLAQGDIKVSPRARALAAKQNVSPALAAPTGPYGRIIERDIRAIRQNGEGFGGRLPAGAQAVEKAAAAPQGAADAAAEYEDVQFTGIRRLISAGMAASLSLIPQLTHNFSFDATEILALRSNIKQNAEKFGLASITLNDFILYAVSRVLPRYPQLNAHMLDGVTIRKFRDVNLGMAVDTPRGLMVPKIRLANRKSLAQIAAEAKSLAKQAQDGSISPDDLAGGTFTVSNLGTFGVESFTPVINPPETGILGVDCITQRPRAGAGGEIKLYPAMGISLTYDHRAIDGAPASRFAQEVCRMLENFTLLTLAGA